MIADWIFFALEPEERAAVRGDFEELGVGEVRAVVEAIGLVGRRQVELWTGTRGFLAAVGLIAPGWILSQEMAGWYGFFSRQVTALWSHGVRIENGLPATDDFVNLVCGAMLVLAWWWAAGFSLGSVMRRSAWIYVWAMCALLWTPPLLLTLKIHALGHLPSVFAMEGGLVFLPSSLGVAAGVRAEIIPLKRTVIFAGLIVLLTVVMQVEETRVHLGFLAWEAGEELKAGLVWSPRVLPFLAIAWQAALLTMRPKFKERV